MDTTTPTPRPGVNGGIPTDGLHPPKDAATYPGPGGVELARSKPRPVSLTTIIAPCASSSARTTAPVCPECRATLASASATAPETASQTSSGQLEV